MVTVTRFKSPNYLAFFLVLTATIVFLPVANFPLPPLLDYPNHLARLWLIQGGVSVSPVDHFYREDWRGIGTNIGIDIVAKLFKGIISAFFLGRILLALAILLPPVGAIALNASEFGGLSPWHLIFFFFAFNLTLLFGFLNFEIGLGVALFCASADRKLRLGGNTLLIYCARLFLGIALIVIHPFALLFYSALLAGIEFGQTVPALSFSSISARIFRAVPAVAVCLLPIALFLLWTRVLPGSPGYSPTLSFHTPLGAIKTLFTPFESYNIKIDGLFVLPLLAIVGYAASRRSIKIHMGLFLAAGVLAVAALLMPMKTAQASWLSERFAIMAVLAALAGARLGIGNGRGKAVALAALAFTLVVSRTSWIWWNWSASVPMVTSMRAVLAHVPPGAAVLSVQHEMSNYDLNHPLPGRVLGEFTPAYRHYSALIVPWRHAFIPNLFAESGKQPIKVVSPWNQIADPLGGGLPPVSLFHDLSRAPGYMQQWKLRFDYVLVLNADRPDRSGPFRPPAELELVENAGFAELFRIKHLKGWTQNTSQ